MGGVQEVGNYSCAQGLKRVSLVLVIGPTRVIHEMNFEFLIGGSNGLGSRKRLS